MSGKCNHLHPPSSAKLGLAVSCDRDCQTQTKKTLPLLIFFLLTSSSLAIPSLNTDQVCFVSGTLIAKSLPDFGFSDSVLTDLGWQFEKPAAKIISNTMTPSSYHTVPAAALLAMFGFACITLSKDKKSWLAVISYLLCLSHAKIYISTQEKTASIFFFKRSYLTTAEFEIPAQTQTISYDLPFISDFNQATPEPSTGFINKTFTCFTPEFTSDEPSRAPPFEKHKYS